jgi:hypothetical protein
MHRYHRLNVGAQVVRVGQCKCFRRLLRSVWALLVMEVMTRKSNGRCRTNVSREASNRTLLARVVSSGTLGHPSSVNIEPRWQIEESFVASKYSLSDKIPLVMLDVTEGY